MVIGEPSHWLPIALLPASYARPGKLFTANRALMVAQVGVLNIEVLERIVDGVVNILRGNRTP